MAESILFNVAGSIITKLGSLASGERVLIWGVNDEIEKLRGTLSAIEAVLLDAEEQQSKSHAVANWLSRLKDALCDVDDLIDDFSYEALRRQVMTKHRKKTKQVRIFFSKSNQVAFGHKMGHEVKEIREKLDAIAADKTQFHFSERMRDTRDDELREKRNTHSFICEEEVIGRDDDKKAIIDHLMDTNIKEDISVVAIVGIGGLGKTALLQSVYNNEKITEYFELKLWVCIFEEFDVKVIVEKIIESATNTRHEPLEMDLLQSKLRREIDGKKYLLIMDDVWNDNYEKWVSLKRLLMGGAPGSKIVITTRSERVAKTCDTTILHSLEGLSEHNSWLLFKKMAFKGEEEVENTNLIKIGKVIAAKLKGVPLAIRIIGRLLYYKKSEVDWLTFKDKELYTVMHQENEIQSILKLSFNHLPSNLKQCFTYCALFPKDYKIEKDEVIKQWVAHGFVQPHGTNKPIEDIGDDYFMELSWRSFFQDIRKNKWGDIIECKMHDFMHDLACSIVENECMFVNVDAGPIDKRTRHVSLSFDSSRNKKLQLPESLFEAKTMRTFLLQYYPPPHSTPGYNRSLLNKILSNFLRLRTLKLSSNWITELPKSISRLIHLRYLDLSWNLDIKFLPNSITELYNLQTIILRKCWDLRELPRDTKNWINLRHLDLDGCDNLTGMPKGLGGLTGLQTMNVFVLGEDDGSRLNELNGLNNLRGSLSVRGLKFCRTVDLQKNANYLKLKPGLRELKLDWDHYKDRFRVGSLNDDERVLECLQPHPNVREISICGFQGVRLCNWLSSNSLVHLVTIRLSSCVRLQHLPQFDQFPFLRHLDLQNLTCVEYIDNNDSLSESTFFPSLEELSISNMPNLKGWWKGEISAKLAQKSVSLPTFPSLSQLEIVDCCHLTCIPLHPPLQALKIGGVGMHLLEMVMKTTTDLAAESSSTMFKLNSLCLRRIEDLVFLSEELFCNLTALEYLQIEYCNNLQISFSRVEEHLIDENDAGVLWKKLARLRYLSLCGIPKLECLPKGLQHLTTLRDIYIKNCPNLASLPEWIGNLSSLSTMSISDCPKLTSLPEGMCHLTSLTKLDISYCSKLTSLLEGIGNLTSLSTLSISNCSKLTSLPEGMRHLTSFTELDIRSCSNLTSLFDGIDHLTSLSRLVIYSCPNLNSLPEGMRRLHSLQTLEIGNCSQLLARCKEGVGEDWPKIAHVPDLRFS